MADSVKMDMTATVRVHQPGNRVTVHWHEPVTVAEMIEFEDGVDRWVRKSREARIADQAKQGG